MLSAGGLSFVLQCDDILADDAAVAPKFRQVVALGENTDELHRALAARAARSVWFVVYIRHSQRAMLVKPQVKIRPVEGANATGPIRALLGDTVVILPRRPGPQSLRWGSQGAPQKRGSVVRLLILNFLSAAAVAICGAAARIGISRSIRICCG